MREKSRVRCPEDVTLVVVGPLPGRGDPEYREPECRQAGALGLVVLSYLTYDNVIQWEDDMRGRWMLALSQWP